MAKKSVYVSIAPGSYRQAKSQVLSGQANLLKTLKTLQNLRILSRRKRDLRNQLIRLMEQIVREVNKIENKFPQAQVPKKYKRKKSRAKKKKVSKNKPDVAMKRDYSKKQEIDEELFEIQRKLNNLR